LTDVGIYAKRRDQPRPQIDGRLDVVRLPARQRNVEIVLDADIDR